jgi:membrane protease subunit HflK
MALGDGAQRGKGGLAWFSTGNPNFNDRIVYYIIGGFFALIFLFTCFYSVDTDEQAVVLRFGQYVSTEESGLHMKMPFWVDEAIKVKTKLILQEEFGFRSEFSRSGRTNYSTDNFDEESLMLTGDLNVADVEWIVQFQVSDPKKFLFRVRDPLTTVRDISHAIMRRVVGDRLVTDVLTVGRAEISSEAQRLMQEIMDRYDIGVRIVGVKMQDVNPPESVKPSFNDVNSAKQEQEQTINQAERNYNKQVPEAKGEADQLIAEAQGYAATTVNRARGDAEKLDAVLREYQKAPDVTRRRLYLDAMQEVLQRVNQLVLVDEKAKGVLPLYSGGAVKPVVVPDSSAAPSPEPKK